MSDRLTGLRHSELTGRHRLRIHRDWLGRAMMVLQVEWRGLHTTFIAGHTDTQWATCWRDARIEDVEVEALRPAFRVAFTAAADAGEDRRQTAAPQS